MDRDGLWRAPKVLIAKGGDKKHKYNTDIKSIIKGKEIKDTEACLSEKALEPIAESVMDMPGLYEPKVSNEEDILENYNMFLRFIILVLTIVLLFWVLPPNVARTINLVISK